jgi:predicted dehydrogenase
LTQRVQTAAINRRTFVLSAGATAVLGANDRIRGAIIGSGGRGRLLTGAFKELGVEMAAVCDVYARNREAGLQVASTGAKGYDNYRRMLEDKSIDVVVIATPDHWHAQMTIDAVEAGKDVYLEKPLAHTIDEGFRIIEATRRTKRIVQIGTQRRSFDLFQNAKQIMDSGQLGEVRLVNSWWVNTSPTALPTPKLEGDLDWNQWLGSAPKRPLDPVRFRSWSWFWDYSGGLLIGQGAHVIDAINWLMNSEYPLSVSCSGKPMIKGAEAPETASMCVEYPEYLAVFTLGYKAMRYITFSDQMKQFHGSKARFDVGRESYSLYPENAKVLDVAATIDIRKPGAFNHATFTHIQNLMDCVRSRKDPNATVEMGQSTNIVLCMAMESLKTGKRLKWNPRSRRVEA